MTTKTEIIRTVLVVWFLAATIYVAYDIWNEYEVKGIKAAYQEGVENTVNELISQVEKSGCDPIDVYSGDKKLQLVSYVCLSGMQATVPSSEQKKK